ncbi:MAG TPA: FAD-dependent oxidoreductase [Myxococcota bacterium]|nr:FAD-dependent oxidoreductase [Myxococcota bacterium]
MTRLERCDVAVVGGGSAGVAAALAAARLGARTLLFESQTELGGNVAHALVHTICGLYFNDAESPVLAQPGIAAQVAQRLARHERAAPPERAGRVWYLPTRPAEVVATYTELCRAERALEVRLASRAVAGVLAAEPSQESALRIEGPDGTGDVRAKVVVEAGGSADLACAAGADTELAAPEELQRASYIFRIEGADTSQLAGFARLRLNAALATGVRAGALAPGSDAIVVRASGRPGELFATLNLPRPDGDVREARASAEAIFRYLRETRPAFAEARLAQCAERLGVREGRRIAGLLRVTAEDVLSGRRRDDEVALSTWPIELWQSHQRPVFEMPSGACSVPLGALISRSHARLGAAGRCLSATREALGALRVIGTSLATGEAIGVAAALAAERGKALAEIAPSEIRGRVRSP